MSISHNEIDRHFRSLDDREEPQRQPTELEEAYDRIEYLEQELETWTKRCEKLEDLCEKYAEILSAFNPELQEIYKTT